ncbi:MAG TPA: SH3 domain-containing protein, partial [Clostridia bacterium]|nr:SH3 domain-containing protein [Clostridia bacterium]
MKKFLISLILVCAILACANLGLAQASDFVTAVIDGKTSDRVHLRKSATTESKSLGLYFTGTEVVCKPDARAEWIWVYIGQEAGYIKSEFLHFATDAGTVKSQQPSGTVKTPKGGGWVNLRVGPSLEYSVACKLYLGDSVTILGETAAHWYYVKAGAQYGYVMTDYVTMGAAASTVPDPAALSAYRSVLLNKEPFIRAFDHQSMNIDQLISTFEGGSMEISRFAVVDMDRDGTPEVILSEMVNGFEYGFEVLHVRDGVVYGYDFVARALSDLKTDGTFSFSSGAADNGFGTVRFAPYAYQSDDITY